MTQRIVIDPEVCGGRPIIAEGTPEQVAADPASVTGFYLKTLLERQAAAVVEAVPVKARRKRVVA